MNHQKIIYLKTRHIFESSNINLKSERFRKSKFSLSKVKYSTYYFHIKTKILVDFQICISVPLRYVNDNKKQE